MYQTPEGVVWKVQRGDSGYLYAKELVNIGAREWEFVFVKGGLRNLSADMKLTLEAAQKFGQLYGVCCVCGRTLTNEVSIAAGIGPICSGRLA